MFDCFFSGKGILSVNVGLVLDYSLTVYATMIRLALYDTVRKSPSISADLGRGTAHFSAGQFLPLNRPDYLHEYSPYYGRPDEATSIKFTTYCARNSRNLICYMLDQAKLLTLREPEKVLKHEVERRSRLNENFGPPQKVHQ
jgi:hypothetical protein